MDDAGQQNLKTIYLFSGLGADETVFTKLQFPSYNIRFIRWIRPFDAETTEEYCKRLLTQITTSFPVLLGVSFGGMIAVEVTKLIPVEKVIIISSAAKREDLPWYFNIISALSLHKIVPTKLLKYPNAFTSRMFGVNTKEDKRILANMLKNTDSFFLKWAIDKIFNWRNTTTQVNTVRLHGTNDHILPAKIKKVDYPIIGGGHLMLMNRHIEINMLLSQILP